MHMFKRKRHSMRADPEGRSHVRHRVVVGMPLTFRAEVMPGREPFERTFTVESVMANGRVELIGLAGQHAESEFEPTR